MSKKKKIHNKKQSSQIERTVLKELKIGIDTCYWCNVDLIHFEEIPDFEGVTIFEFMDTGESFYACFSCMDKRHLERIKKVQEEAKNIYPTKNRKGIDRCYKCSFDFIQFKKPSEYRGTKIMLTAKSKTSVILCAGCNN